MRADCCTKSEFELKTVDIHAHLLAATTGLGRFYDRLAISLFAKKLGADPKKLLADPAQEYRAVVLHNVTSSRHVAQTVLFGVDARVDKSGKELYVDPTVCARNEEVYDLYLKAPDLIIPFMSVNPLRPDAVERVRRYAEMGFRGVKFLQNFWGIDLRNRRFRPFFQTLANLNLPLIVHIGSESSVGSFKAYETARMLEGPLQEGVTTVAAHMGLSYSPFAPLRALSKKPKHFGEDYHRLLEMLKSHDNLYADLSAILTPVRARALPHLADQYQIHDKLLFGTDFPVPFTVYLNSYGLPFAVRRRLAKIANPLDRYVHALLYFFPADHPLWRNWRKILPR